jgi:protein-histidine pros-kinase
MSSPARTWIESNFRAILDAAPDAMLVVNDEGRIVLANLQTEELFGYSGSELLGQKVEVLVPPRFVAKHPDHRKEYFAQNPHVRPMGAGLDLFGSRKNGTEFPVEISLSPIQTPDGIMVVSAIRDVTERKLAQHRIRKLNGELETALRRSEKLAAAGRLISTIAHEINNPLESLSHVLYLLRLEPGLGQSGKGLLELAEQEVARLANISRQTLAPHRETKLPVVTKVSELLDDVLATIHRRLESAQIQVCREYQTEGEVTIYPSELRQVCTNLITNAVDAMDELGELTLSIETLPDATVSVRVSDTGCGIPAENLDTIFEPFFTTKGEKGTGIGLWVSKSIVDKLGGRIEVVSSTTGKTGTCFSIFLPATNPETRATGLSDSSLPLGLQVRLD